MTDVIAIDDLRVDARVGVTDDERAKPQSLLVSLEIKLDLARAAARDDLSDTIDYDWLATAVADLIRRDEAYLLEHLAGKVADLVSAVKGVQGVTVEIAKESVPTQERVGNVRVRLER
jgi:dihydroneopterin aldolase